MLSFNPESNTDRENYKLLIGSVVPRPIAFVTSEGEDGTINGAPFSYFNIASPNPPMLSISIKREGGIVKDTARNILRSKEFVVHVVDQENVEKVNITAASLAPNESEIKKANLTLADSEQVSVPGIMEAKVRFECTLEHSIELGENNTVEADLIIGKVVRFHIDEDIYEDGSIDYLKLGAMSRLAGPNYASIGEIMSLERPK